MCSRGGEVVEVGTKGRFQARTPPPTTPPSIDPSPQPPASNATLLLPP